MKKINFILLAIILISSITLVSCGDKTTNSNDLGSESTSNVSEMSSDASEFESVVEEISEPLLDDMSEELVSLPFIPFD